MGSLQPFLQQRGHAVGKREEILADIGGATNHRVLIANSGQSPIATPVVRPYDAARLDVVLHSWSQTGRRRIGYAPKTDATKVFILIFNRDKDQCLASRTSSSLPRPPTTYVCFVYLHRTRQAITTRAHHGFAKLVKPYPNGFIPLESQNTLKSQSTDAVLLTNNIPHGPKPQSERLSRTLKYRSRCYRGLKSTALTMIQLARRLPSLSVLTTRTPETIGPSQSRQVLTAGFLRAKPMLEFDLRAWVVLHTHTYYILGLLESSG